MNITRRIERLEEALKVEAIVLHYSDGSTRQIPADCLPDAYIDLLEGRRTPALETILQADDASDTSGKISMFGLIKAIHRSMERMKAKAAE